MVPFVFLLLAAVATRFALVQSQRLAPWFLLVGVFMFGGLWLLGRLRIPWPDFGLWTVLVLNPYLFSTMSFVLIVAGLIGTTVKAARRRGWLSK